MRTILIGVAAALVAGLLLIQLVPYGRAHTNPPVTEEPSWDSPRTRELAVTACFDCHSNETEWPWYSNVAPASWLLQRDVEEGRTKLNFSTWGTGEQEAEEAAGSVREGEMPPAMYPVLHPEARLSDADRQALIDGLAATLGDEGDGEGDGEGEGEDD